MKAGQHKFHDRLSYLLLVVTNSCFQLLGKAIDVVQRLDRMTSLVLVFVENAQALLRTIEVQTTKKLA